MVKEDATADYSDKEMHAALEINDGQARVPEEGSTFEKLPTVGAIGTAVTEGIFRTFGPCQGMITEALRRTVDSVNSAHVRL